jgi:para-nitrobenzyl esterase
MLRPTLCVCLALVPQLACGRHDSNIGDSGARADAPPDASCVPGSASGPGIVAVDTGVLAGAQEGGTYAYKGIPYAAPPIGELRWKPPTPPACFSGMRDATGFGYVCMQEDASGTPVGSEDCLTLNVWTPKATPSATLPVLFFIHGGSEVEGSSSLKAVGIDVYDGAALAAHGAVVVTINYRLGPLGFLAHPGLDAEDPHGASGNYGLLDAIAALKWVQRNIGAFGGDPGHVMVFGQSAGGVNTCALLGSPLSAGLFSSAMALSGGCTAWPRPTAETVGAMLAKNVGCEGDDVVACMRKKSAGAVIAALPREYRAGGVAYAPVIDGWVLGQAPFDAITTGQHHHMPLILGTTVDEMTTLVRHFAPQPIADDAAYLDALHTYFGAAIGDQVAKAYPSSQFPDPEHAFVQATTDATFVCPARSAARLLAATQSDPVRRYSFAHAFPTGPLAPYRAGHSLDLFFAFGHPDYQGYSASPEEHQLAEQLMGYVIRFAATGDPNGGDAPDWPAYDPKTDLDLRVDIGLGPESGLRQPACDAWDALEGGHAR